MLRSRNKMLSWIMVLMMVMSAFAGMTMTVSAQDVIEETVSDIEAPSENAESEGESALVQDGEVPQSETPEILTENMEPADAPPASETPWNGKSDTSWYKEDSSKFTVTTAEQLAGLAELVNNGNKFENKTINLGADIYLNSDDNKTEHDWMPIGRIRARTSENGPGTGFPMMLPFEEQNPFYGTLDGNEHTIYNLYVTGKSPSEGDLKGVGNALIGYNCGTVKNLEVTGSVSGTRRSAGIVGFNGKTGHIENCASKADVRGNGNGSNRGTGGIVGTNQGKIFYCVNRGNVHNYGMAGGIAGINDGGTVQYCCNIGRITSAQPRAGAIVGGNGTQDNTPGSTVTDCYYYFISCKSGTSGGESGYDTMPSDTKAFTKNGKIAGESETVFVILERDCPGKFKISKTDGMPTLPWLDAEEIEDPIEIPDVEHEITVEDPEG